VPKAFRDNPSWAAHASVPTVRGAIERIVDGDRAERREALQMARSAIDRFQNGFSNEQRKSTNVGISLTKQMYRERIRDAFF
jgi:hypothetical protein